MPNGLLKGLKPEDLADLYSYLQTLKPPKAAGGLKSVAVFKGGPQTVT